MDIEANLSDLLRERRFTWWKISDKEFIYDIHEYNSLFYIAVSFKQLVSCTVREHWFFGQLLL